MTQEAGRASSKLHLSTTHLGTGVHTCFPTQICDSNCLPAENALTGLCPLSNINEIVAGTVTELAKYSPPPFAAVQLFHTVCHLGLGFRLIWSLRKCRGYYHTRSEIPSHSKRVLRCPTRTGRHSSKQKRVCFYLKPPYAVEKMQNNLCIKKRIMT